MKKIIESGDLQHIARKISYCVTMIELSSDDSERAYYLPQIKQTVREIKRIINESEPAQDPAPIS